MLSNIDDSTLVLFKRKGGPFKALFSIIKGSHDWMSRRKLGSKVRSVGFFHPKEYPIYK